LKRMPNALKISSRISIFHPKVKIDRFVYQTTVVFL
jgi:hypothetical protein